MKDPTYRSHLQGNELLVQTSHSSSKHRHKTQQTTQSLCLFLFLSYFQHFKKLLFFHKYKSHKIPFFVETMSDTEITPDQPAVPPQTEAPPQPNPSAALSFTIWPPTQRTRDAVVNRLIETLSSPSVLSKRYGTLSSDEASAAAHQIEHEAFSATDASAATSTDGIETLQLYSKEISKRMLETVKARAPPGAAAVEGVATVVSE